MTETRRLLVDGSVQEVTLHDSGYFTARTGMERRAEDYPHLVPCQPSTVICVHLNYRSRVVELSYPWTDAPTYFTKPVSCLNGHKGLVVRPANCQFLNYEGEIAAVVGRVTRNIRPEQAAEYIAGYTIANDLGLHDFRDTDANSMLRVKGSDTLGAVGPGLVTDWDFRGKQIVTRVNGEVVQSSDTDDMIWDPHYLLADLSRTITLRPGDLILTGTPANSRPVEPGDHVEVEVDGLGKLSNDIVGGKSAVPIEFGAPPSTSDNVTSVALGRPRQ